jgi:hypothetical protein
MTCENCGAVLELVTQSGGTKEGYFSEKYKCVECGRNGYISGEADNPPQQWEKSGVCQ